MGIGGEIAALEVEIERVRAAMNNGTWRGTEAEALARIAELKEELRILEWTDLADARD
jgi:hypothetical protein